MTILALTLLEAIRDQLDDTGGDRPVITDYYAAWQADDGPCLWKNRELVRLLNLTLRELGQRRPIKDSSTDYDLGLIAGERHYELLPEIVRLESVTRASDGEPLVKTTVAEMQAVARWHRHQREWLRTDWRTETGWPTHYLLDEQRGYLTVYPTPVAGAADTLRCVVWRTYINEVAWDDLADEETPAIAISEVPDHYFDALLAGVCARAYRKRDSDTYAPQLAAQHEAEFTLRVGPSMSLHQLDAEARWANCPGHSTPRTFLAR